MGQERPAIGFIGLGAIGRPIAERLVRGDFGVIAYDLRPEATQGFVTASCPGDVADRSDLVFGCLAAPSSFREAVLGKDGLVNGTRARGYVHLGTSGGDLVRELAAGLGRAGITILDAPVTGGVKRARDGALTAMIAGPPDAFDAAAPAIRTYASKLVYLGGAVGLAQAMKVVNNAVGLANMSAAAEALVVGAKAGLRPETMLKILNSGSGQNSATLLKIAQHVLPGTFDFGGSLRIVIKDLELYLQEAAKLGVSTPIGAQVMKAYRDAAAEFSADDDMTSVIRIFERDAGVEVRAAGVPASE